jgi:DHA1 family inner membrane transport protein
MLRCTTTFEAILDHFAVAGLRPVARPGLVLLALAMGGFAIGTTEFGTMGLVPYFAASLGIDAPHAGEVISAYALGVVVGAPVVAILAGKFQRRTLLVWLMVSFAVTNGLSALAPNFQWMMALRFLAGLPHGAYFGIAALVAASVVPPAKRGQAISRVLMGLTIATIIGVPLANGIGQVVGWRWAFSLVALIAVATALLVYFLVPAVPAAKTSVLQELGVLRIRQVWLSLGMGAVGFGGMFAVYTYLASTLLNVTHAAPAVVPVMLGIFGVGLTVGNLVSGWLADKALMPTIGGVLLWCAATLALYPFAIHSIWMMAVLVFLVGSGGGLGTPLQARLMEVAEHGQGLAAALNQSAFNVANALGPWLAGMAIAAGFGWQSAGWVGCVLALGGLVLWIVAVLDQQRQDKQSQDTLSLVTSQKARS